MTVKWDNFLPSSNITTISDVHCVYCFCCCTFPALIRAKEGLFFPVAARSPMRVTPRQNPPSMTIKVEQKCLVNLGIIE